MNATPETTPTLKALRNAAGLTTRAAAARLSEAMGEKRTRSHVSIINIEKRGAKNDDVIEGLARIYGVKRGVIKAAIKSLKN